MKGENNKMKKASNQKLNELVSEYRRTGNDDLFTDIYLEVKSRVKNEGFYRSAKLSYNVSKEESEPIVDDTIMDAVQGYETFGTAYEFYNYFSSILSKRVKDYARYLSRDKRGGRSENETLESLHASSDLSSFIPRANEDDEEFVEHIQKGSEQRQLLAELLDKADDKSRQAVVALLNSESYLAAAKLLGIDDKTVKRRVEKVAKLYSVKQFGNLADYLTIPTEKQVG